jgi:Na+/melibiose symporter-like transporter
VPILEYGRDDTPHTGQTFLYFGSLTLFIYLATPAASLADIQTSFMLKNTLRATATQISMFRLLTGVPVYFAFACGLVRDQWNPLGLRDRGYFLIFAPATAAVFIWLASSQITYRGLVIGMLLAMLASRFTLAAYQGLMALVGQEKLMSGRLSALWMVVQAVPGVAGAVASGFISEHLPAKAAFLIVAGATCCIGSMGLWKPRSVFKHTYDEPQAARATFVEDVRRLVHHRAIYPAVLICFLWNFAPGSATPLQYYLGDKLHASDSVFSYFNGIFAASFVPTFLLYGLLCKRVSLNKLLWWGTIIAVPQLVPLAFIHTAKLALVMAVPIGLLGGLAQAAYIDLAMRSCPPGLQGTLMMLVDGVYALSSRGGDLLGSAIYNSSPTNGFLYCVIATTAVYALILPLILLVPKKLIATADGEANADIGFEVVTKEPTTEPA